MRQIGFFIDHHFAATSHFKGCHGGIGGVAKNAMRRRERFGTRIMGADGAVSFSQSFFLERGGEGEESMRKYFAKWSPYRIRKVHVRLIGKNEIYRPGSELAGIEGTREMDHFAGADTPKYDAVTTTDGLHDVDAEDLVSGEKEVVVRKVVRKYRVKTRLASCFCSSCQISINRYEECDINRTYPALVPAMMNGEVKGTVIMDTGVEPIGVDEPQEIKFRSRAK